MEDSTPVPKKTTRARKTVTQPVSTSAATSLITPSSVKPLAGVTQVFDDLVSKIIQSKKEFDNLQKEIDQIRQDWERQQKHYELELVQQKTQEELERKREEETYKYNTTLVRKRAEDEFQDKKMSWEKDLAQKKEELEVQRKELEQLRKLAADFDSQKESAVKMAQGLLEKELTEKFDQEKKLREQEVKAEKDLLNMRISTLETDNGRLSKEVEILKRSLDQSTREVKEIAVKVIESGQPKNQISSVVDKTS